MLKIYQVDAFAASLFAGNPAAVVPLPYWPADQLLQSIAAENNLAETSFIVVNDNQWELRWFTPTAEVALCGHATLAAAHVVFEHIEHSATAVEFSTRESGLLKVSKLSDGRLAMSFPSIPVEPYEHANLVSTALNATPSSLWQGAYSESQFDIVAVFPNESAVTDLSPDFSNFAPLGSRGVIATAPGNSCHFVSRYFAPEFGIPEDPVTGSAHCLTAPYWGKVLNQTELNAVQISPRVGHVLCKLSSDRVELVGQTVEYLQGTLSIELK